jgi:hypothetical protein
MKTLTKKAERIVQLAEHVALAVAAASANPESSNAWLDAVLCNDELLARFQEWEVEARPK